MKHAPQMARKRLIRRIAERRSIYFTQWVCPWCVTPFSAKPKILDRCHCGASVQTNDWIVRPIYDDEPTGEHITIDDD